MRSARNQHLNGRHGTSARGKRNPEHISQIITTSLIGGAVTNSPQSKAEALAELEQRINPKLKQGIYEFHLEEFLEIVEGTQCADG
jgi:hypothetical protein